MEEAKPSKRRPEPSDIDDLMDIICNGKSLRKACEELGLDPPSTHRWLEGNEDRRQHYARAREMRADYFQEQALTLSLSAALGKKVGEHSVDPAGARVALDAIKWATARMAPKSEPTKKIAINHLFNGTDEELDAAIAELTDSDQDEDPAEA